nr:pseudaminic acid biosynthesis-associated methylase [uncultured Oscillibacter sp.]
MATPELFAAHLTVFRDMLRRVESVESVCELGASYGLNMMILHTLLPHVELTGVEINHKAAEMLAQLPYVTAIESSVYQTQLTGQYDMVLSKGVAVCQDGEKLEEYYQILYSLSKRYIVLCEYYNPTPVKVQHREAWLYKRDFPGEMMDRYPDLKLLDYGFQYHRDYLFPVDDFNWFVLEKR